MPPSRRIDYKGAKTDQKRQSNTELNRQKFLAEIRGKFSNQRLGQPVTKDDVIHHSDEYGNIHKRSFKKVKSGGEIYRPKLPPKTAAKSQKHASMLNENRRASDIVKQTSHDIVAQLNELDKNIAQEIVEQDIQTQEKAIRIRILKRQNNYNKRKDLNGSFSVWSESSISKATNDQ